MRQPHLQQVCICFRFVLPQKNELQTSGRTWLHLQKPGKSLGKCEERCGFARAAANLPGIPAGMRIATPRRSKVRHAQLRPTARAGQRSLGAPLPTKGVPLRGPMHWFAMTCKRWVRVSGCKNVVRNDMKKTGTCQRVQGRDAGVLLGKVLAHADTRQVSACHCEERSDVAIRSPCSSRKRKANTLGEYEKHYGSQ